MNSPPLSSRAETAPSDGSTSSSTDLVHALSYEQVQRLCGVLTEPVKFPPKDPGSNFPILDITPAGIVKAVRHRLIQRGIEVCDIRMNGSAASYCLCETHTNDLPELKFNDIDLIFDVPNARDNNTFRVIKEEVLMSLLEFFPEESSKSRISPHLLEETYVRKMVLVMTDKLAWSLLSLGDEHSTRSIELKFVHKIRRQFEFTVDSFQIFLDDYFTFGKCAAESPVATSAKFFPTIHAMSVYSDYDQAMTHLNKRLIHTHNPEEIRGGGLLKYCTLLVHGFKPADESQIKHLEPYMCSRFFIDFPTVSQQYYRILKCVMTRFLSVREIGKCREFLEILFKVVNSRARCLMESERQKTMSVILQISFQVGQPLLHLPTMPHVPMFPSCYPLHPPPCVPLRVQSTSNAYHHHPPPSPSPSLSMSHHHHHHNHTRPNSYHTHHNRRHFTPTSFSTLNHHGNHHNHHHQPRAPWSAVKRTPTAEVR